MFRNILRSQLGGSSVFSAGLGQMESLSTDVNVTGHAGADTIYRGKQYINYIGEPYIIYIACS
jgi:hypothetical protein